MISDLLVGTAVLAVLTVALVAWGSAREAEHQQRLQSGGRTAKAQVCGLDGDSLCASYWARLRYDNDGRSVTTTVPISGAQYQRLRVGVDVPVTYLPGQPGSARLAPLERGTYSGASQELSAGEAERLRRLAR